MTPDQIMNSIEPATGGIDACRPYVSVPLDLLDPEYSVVYLFGSTWCFSGEIKVMTNNKDYKKISVDLDGRFVCAAVVDSDKDLSGVPVKDIDTKNKWLIVPNRVTNV